MKRAWRRAERTTAPVGGRLRSAHLLREIDSSLGIIECYRALAPEENSFLLDSATGAADVGRYSFAGCRPFLIFESKGSMVTIREGGSVVRKRGNPFVELRALLSRYRIDPATYQNVRLPFLGGAVGYFGYELNSQLEKLPCLGTDDLGLPDCYFMLVDAVLIYDHLEHRLYLSTVGFDPDPEVAREKAQARLDEMGSWLARLEQQRGLSPGPEPGTIEDVGDREGKELIVRQMFDEAQYMDAVRKAREHIFAGDVFEVCLTHRFESDFAADAFDLYTELRRINPAPFASYLNLPGVKIVSSSPERFLRLERDRKCTSRPIKGTRPRGQTPGEDQALHQDLLSSTKDRAENMMIVDLVRNDFGRVCEVGTVDVSELMIIEKYATVFQMVSTIVGKLEEGKDGLDLVQACFPGGSMTGAPKIEAMTIIDALEPVKRGIYSGSIGYLDFSGNLDLNIVIRTILVKDGKAYFQVGGAVVADSDPRGEYLETLDKARALVRALTTATQRHAAVPVSER